MSFITDTDAPKQRLWLLRWRLDFANRPTKVGHWGRPEVQQSGMAAFQMKEGLVRACIEGKHIRTKEVKIFSECDGWDYNVFKWIACAFVQGMVRGEVTPYTRAVGLKLVTRNKEIEVYDTGDVLVLPRTEEDKKFHYATFGK